MNTVISNDTTDEPSVEILLDLVKTTLDDFKAQDLVVIPLAGKSSIADYMVIASGTSSRQLGAMAENLLSALKAVGMKGMTVTGKRQGDWVLVDANDIIIHLFRPEVREFYNLEKIWIGDAVHTAEA
jgi:ribosome-associated protein